MRHLMLKVMFLNLFLFLLLIPSVQASQNSNDVNEDIERISPQAIVDSQLDSLNIEELKGFWEKISKEYGGFLPESQKGSLYDFLKGEKSFSFQEWVSGFIKFLSVIPRSLLQYR